MAEARRGVCRSCEKRADVYPTQRTGGGTYRRGGRWYRSSICGDCVLRLLPNAQVHAGATTSRFSVLSLVKIAEGMETDKAREAAAAWRARREAARS